MNWVTSRAAKKLIEHAQNEKSNLIQAASNHVNGAIGLVAEKPWITFCV